jgi:hypothetical protein
VRREDAAREATLVVPVAAVKIRKSKHGVSAKSLQPLAEHVARPLGSGKVHG